MIEVNDQMNNTIRLEKPPVRIVSLVPSQTELLYDLGLDQTVVGITKFCIHPKKWFETKTRVGGTKQINFDTLHSLKPDLIIANKEENTKEMIEELQKSYPVYVSDILTISDALDMIKQVGILSNAEEKADHIISAVNEDFVALPSFQGKVLYFMWNNPLMVAGKATFIGNVLESIGFENSAGDPEARYIEIELNKIEALKPDYLLLSSEPFPFSETIRKELEMRTGIKTLIVDGEMFSWYGSRMLKMKKYFDQLRQEIT